MSYSTSNPPSLIAQAPAGGRKVWLYSSTDGATTVRVSGYFTNGYLLGMRAGDILLMIDTDAAPIAASWMIVNAATTTTTDVSDGVAITETDSD